MYIYAKNTINKYASAPNDPVSMMNNGRSCEGRRLAVTSSVTPFLSFSTGTKDLLVKVPCLYQGRQE